jgi:TPR repeat protein
MNRSLAQLVPVGLLILVPVLLVSSCAQYRNAQAFMKAVKANDANAALGLIARDPTLVNIPLRGSRTETYSLTSDEGATNRPLHAAVEAGHVAMVKLLLDRGANVNAVTRDGKAALHLAARTLRADLVALLLDRGAAVNPADKTRSTPLHYAVEGYSPDVPAHVTMLIARGASIEARDEEGKTPLHRAATSAPVAAALCAAGADVGARDKAGKTPADLARQAGDAAYAAWLDSADGCRGLSEAHARGGDVSEDRQRVSARLYQCQQGEFDDCSAAGYAFGRGIGAEVDHRRAADLYRRACEGGFMPGCANLGIVYRDGRGVTTDAVRAVGLFRRACDAGDGGGCASLGYQLEYGEGTARDAVQAGQPSIAKDED